MKDWFAVCIVGLMVVVGTAAGLGGTLAFLLAFGITWYLLTARDIGFVKARDALGIKLLPPIWRRRNWLWLNVMLEDGDTVIKAATIALAMIGAAQMFKPDVVYGAAALIAVFFVSEILRGKATARRRAVRIPDAGGARAETSVIEVAAASSAITRSTLVIPLASDPEPALGMPTDPPPIATAPTGRVVVVRPQQSRKRMPPKQRPVSRPAAVKRSNATKRRLRDKPRRPDRPQLPLPNRKPGGPIATRPRKQQRQRSMPRRRTMRKPMAQIGRSAPNSAAVERH